VSRPKSGVEAVRLCELKQATIRETMVEWEQGRSFTYRGESVPMLQSAMNTWTVEERGGQTLVTSSAEAVLKGGVFGLLLELPMKIVFRRMGAQSLASLKYLAEHGEPYRGSLRDLMPIPASC
jgi:hypothetical protein